MTAPTEEATAEAFAHTALLAGRPGSEAPLRELCGDAVVGVRRALAEAEFTDGRPVHALPVHGLDRAVRRAFAAGHTEEPARCSARRPVGHGRDPHEETGHGDRQPYCDQGTWCRTTTEAEPPPRRGFWAGCAVAVFMTCTGQVRRRGPFPGPWKGAPARQLLLVPGRPVRGRQYRPAGL